MAGNIGTRWRRSKAGCKSALELPTMEAQRIPAEQANSADNQRYAASLRLSVAPMMDWSDT